MQTLKSIAPWNLSGEFCEKWKWLLALVIFLGLICPKPLKKNNCSFICWELIWCRHLGTNQGHLLQPTCWLCHKPMQQQGWARGSWLKNSTSLLQSTDHVANFPIEKKGPEVPIGERVGKEYQANRVCLHCLLAYKCTKILEETLNWFSLSCKPRVIPRSRINKWFVVYTVHSLM